MKRVNYLFLFLAIIFAAFILLVSLQSASKSKLIGNTNLVRNKFYIAKEILPDHSLYPLLMIADRMRLELADSEQRVYLLISYANRRFFYTKKLLIKNNQDLALVTLSKASKYMNSALIESTDLLKNSGVNKKQEYQVLAFFVLENFYTYENFIIEHKVQFGDEERAVIDALFSESLALANQLSTLVNQDK